MAIWADQMPTTTNPNRLLLSDLELLSFIIDESGPITEPLQDPDSTVTKFTPLASKARKPGTQPTSNHVPGYGWPDESV